MQILTYLKNLNASLYIKLHDVLKLPFYYSKSLFIILKYIERQERVEMSFYIKILMYVTGIWIRLILTGGSGSFKNAIKFKISNREIYQQRV